MHALQALGALAACASAVQAFAGTYPLVAFSDSRLPLASLLNPAPASRAATAAQHQQSFSLSRNDVDEAELCSLSSLIVIAAPGLSYSDLALLPSASPDSTIRTALASDSAITLPYVADALAGAKAPVSRLARRYAKCEGRRGAIVIEEVNGLEGTEAGTVKDRQARRKVMQEIDDLVSVLKQAHPAPHAVVISAVRPSLPKPKAASTTKPCPRHRGPRVKRQAGAFGDEEDAEALTREGEDAYVEELLEEMAAEDEADSAALDEMASDLERPVVDDGAALLEAETATLADGEVPTPEKYADAVDPYLAEAESWDSAGSVLDSFQDDDDDEGSGNGTSIFAPKPNSGLFHRYVFFTPALVLSVLITVLILIPTVLVGASALLAIETPQGLETKMTGSVGIDPSKAQ